MHARELVVGLLLSRGLAQRPTDGREAGSPAPEPLHETIQTVFDTDKNGAVSLEEIQSTLDGLAAVAAMGMAGGAAGVAGDSGDAAGQLAARVRAAMEFAPMLLKWMDADSDGALSASELRWVTSAHTRMRQSLKEMTRDIFDAMDADADDTISPEEVTAAMAPAVLGKVVGLLEAGFPVPSLSATATAEHVASLLAMADSDSDGSVGRKEAYGAVSSFKRHFLEAATLLETMGPMLAVFGGGVEGRRGRGAGRSVGRGGRGADTGVEELLASGRVKVARPTHEPPKTEL
jgi:Ca2+-binding EF-hand superfamily protein